MTPESKIDIAQIVLTVIGMFVGPWLAVRWSLKRFRAEKWWEKREQVYTNLLEQLSILRQENFAALAAVGWGGDVHNPGNYQPSERTLEIRRKAYEELQKSIEHGAYLISDEAGKAIDKVVNTEGDFALEHYELLADSLKEAIELIRNEANVEVKPQKKIN